MGPPNVLVSRAGEVKVLDFGIAQVVRPGTLTAGTRTVLHPISFACASLDSCAASRSR